MEAVEKVMSKKDAELKKKTKKNSILETSSSETSSPSCKAAIRGFFLSSFKVWSSWPLKKKKMTTQRRRRKFEQQ